MSNVLRHENWTRSGLLVSRLPDDEIEILEDQAAASIADPAPLGLWGLATGTWMAATVIAGLFPTAAFAATIPVLLIFAGVVQFVAGLFAFRRANVLAATAFCAFGSFNITMALFFGLQATNRLATTGDPVILQGFLLESFGFIALALTLAAMRTNAALILTFALLTIGYVLAGVPMVTNSVGNGTLGFTGEIGGWFLIASALFAYYTGMALVVNSSWMRTIFPVGGEPLR